MAKQNKATLKGYFETGDIPTQQNFADLIESMMSEGQAYVVVETTADEMQNGINLLAAYAAAKVLTPNGAALATDNRACVIVPPGNYCLDEADSEGGFAPLLLDTEFVDVVGLTSDRNIQYIYGATSENGVITQTANDVHISNLKVEIFEDEGVGEGEGGISDVPAAYFPDDNLSLTVVTNCEFIADSNVFSMRNGIEYSGTFTNCTGGNYSFGSSGTASGTFTNCTGGNTSFGSDATASGTFTNCTGGNASFGTFGTASGTFTNCTGGNYSFGSSGTASGTFTNCTGGNTSFGSGATASGTFTNCTGGNASFGSFGTASGTYHFCRLTTGSFPNLALGGKIRACIDDSRFIAELNAVS